MSNTQKENQLTKGKKLGIMDYVALYKMSMRSYFWRVDNRQGMNTLNRRNEITGAAWILSMLIGYGLPIMFIFGVNFNIYYLLLLRKFKSVLKSTELKCYLCVIASAVVLICINIAPMFDSVGEALRHTSFQIATVMSTTGYATTDFNMCSI